MPAGAGSYCRCLRRGAGQFRSSNPERPDPVAEYRNAALLGSQAPDQAVAVLEKALRIDPMYTDARNHLGVAYGLLGRHQDSVNQLRRAAKESPDSALAWTNLGVTLEVVGDIKGASEAYTEAIRLQPDSSEARTRRARLDTLKE
jgi:Flp pilus assembly protein TadD